jgi:arginase family enzyme
VFPHLLRLSAAVHMAEAGVSMAEIAQYLGHDDDRVTARVYARFSPAHLRKAAAALEYDDLGSPNQKITTPDAGNMPEYLVGATGIEPVTPTMSR